MKTVMLINALVWASLLLLNAFLFKDHEHSNYMFYSLIIGFTVVNTALTYFKNKLEKTSKSLCP
jgi:hypothetical protein